MGFNFIKSQFKKNQAVLGWNLINVEVEGGWIWWVELGTSHWQLYFTLLSS